MRRELRRAVRKRRGGAGQLGGVWRRVASWPRSIPQFQPYLEARDGIKSQLEDLALFLRRYADGIEASPARLQQVEERLALLERLKRKYGPALADVIARRDALRARAGRARTAATSGSPSSSASTRPPRDGFLDAARRLSAARRRAAPRRSRRRSKRCWPSWRWSTPSSRCGSTPSRCPKRRGPPRGIDAAEFFVSPNPGEELRPLARIVSGGELSRIMLAIKTLTADVASWLQRRRRPAAERVARRA